MLNVGRVHGKGRGGGWESDECWSMTESLRRPTPHSLSPLRGEGGKDHGRETQSHRLAPGIHPRRAAPRRSRIGSPRAIPKMVRAGDDSTIARTERDDPRDGG